MVQPRALPGPVRHGVGWGLAAKRHPASYSDPRSTQEAMLTYFRYLRHQTVERDNVVEFRGSWSPGWRRAMNRFDHVHGWFSHNKEWIEYIIVVVALWLLMLIAIHQLDLRSAG